MILSESQRDYFSAMASKVSQAMVDCRAKTPYLIKGDPTIVAYECIRDVWWNRQSVKKSCAEHGLSRSGYYELEKKFVVHGLPGLFPDIADTQNPIRLERLVLLAKQARPSLSHTSLLRLAEAISATRDDASLETIANILNSHGYGISQLEDDRQFFGRIQRTFHIWHRLIQKPLGRRNTANRKETFFDDQDPYHRRLELLRQVFYDQDKRIKDLCTQYGIAPRTFNFLTKEYRIYGPWAVFPAESLGSNKQVAPETELRVILAKLQHPKWSGQNIVEALKLRCNRYAVIRILSYWGLDDVEREPVYLDRYVIETDAVKEETFKPVVTAKTLITDESLLSSRRLNRHFELILKKMKTHTYHLCDPGPFMLAPFVNALGVVQAFEAYGPPRLRGKELTATHINSRNRFTVSPCDTMICAKCAGLCWWPN